MCKIEKRQIPARRRRAPSTLERARSNIGKIFCRHFAPTMKIRRLAPN